MHAFADVEERVQVLLWIVTGTDPKIAKAIFSGTRTDTASGYIRRTFAAQQQPMPEVLDRALSHLKVLMGVRNTILHYGAKFEDGTLHASNRLLALPGQEDSIPVRPDVLDRMWLDLQAISRCFVAYLMARPGEVIPESTREFFRQDAQVPWQYKPHARRKESKDSP